MDSKAAQKDIRQLNYSTRLISHNCKVFKHL